MHRHESDGVVFLASQGIEVSSQAQPFHEVTKRGCVECELVVVPIGDFEDIRIEDNLMIIGVFAHDTEKLTYVLDTATRLVGVLRLKRLHESGLLDNHVNDGVEIPLVGACLVNEGNEALERTTCGSSTGRVEHFLTHGFEKGNIALQRGERNTFDCRLADATTWRVDDTHATHVISWIEYELEVRRDVPDFRTVEESRATDDAIGHARAQKHVLEYARLRIRAIEDCDIVITTPLRMEVICHGGNPATLIALICRKEDGDLLALLAAREEFLALARLVVRDNGVGALQDRGSGTIVLLELDGFGIGPIALEIEDIADVGTTPRVDRLVIVADDHEIAMP